MSNNNITPKINPEKVRKMFDSISPSYDLLNRVLSFRRDVRWRRKAIARLGVNPGEAVLDLACGTGDMIVMMQEACPEASIIGGDFSTGMLEGARKKVNSPLVAADATCLPFKDSTFDKLTMTFGFRNVADKPAALAEIYRVLKPGGKICILEFTKPKAKIFAAVYWAYFDIILPRVGNLISKHEDAYTYLPESVKHFPEEGEYRAMIENAGFKELTLTQYDFGICNAAIAVK